MTETRLADVFVEMADTLVDDFDVLDFLQVLTERCVQVLGVSAAGLLLADAQGTLQVVAASSERIRLLELFQIQLGQGPCLDCYATGQAVSVSDLPSTQRWPGFTAAAVELGYGAVQAIPMRLRHEVIGALNLFTVEEGPVDVATLRIGQALADVATIGLLQQRAIHHRDVLAEQLQTALESRILIEQAKGVLAERLHVDVDQAFALLRQGARSHNRRLSDLAGAIVVGARPAPLATAASPAEFTGVGPRPRPAVDR